MYKVPVQNPPVHQQMLKLYESLMQWAASSKKALDRGDFNEHQHFLERMTALQYHFIHLFEPPITASKDEKKACQTIQAAARQTLLILFDYVRNPAKNYPRLCQNFVKLHSGWKAMETHS